jgi:hypothetical protein
MWNIVYLGIIAALIVGLIFYICFKDNNRDPNKGFIYGFSLTIFLASAAAIVYFFKKKK